jgi:hypothetical protein
VPEYGVTCQIWAPLGRLEEPDLGELRKAAAPVDPPGGEQHDGTEVAGKDERTHGFPAQTPS